jgi:hypothetical protein
MESMRVPPILGFTRSDPTHLRAHLDQNDDTAEPSRRIGATARILDVPLNRRRP